MNVRILARKGRPKGALKCGGCHACWKTGQCTRKDDMTLLYEKVPESDGIVFGTPGVRVPSGIAAL